MLKILPSELHFGAILLYSKQDFWMLISLYWSHYFLVIHWRQSFWTRQCIFRCNFWLFARFAFLTSNTNAAYSESLTRHFNFSHSSHIPHCGSNSRSTKTAWIPFLHYSLLAGKKIDYHGRHFLTHNISTMSFVPTRLKNGLLTSGSFIHLRNL